MLNVPSIVKALFKKGGIRKNFRVQFPNGEHADLTNADIVAESVSFTESLCSGNRFQFGLSERSELEFECVDVPNIYGCVIKAGIEIDISSLSIAQITAVASDPGDGALVYDLGPVYYRVPYGTFTVESCPRQHGNMKHRKVTAYGRKPASVVQSNFLEQKYQLGFVMPQVIKQNPLMMVADASNDISAFSTSEATLTMQSTSLSSQFSIGSYRLNIAGTLDRTNTNPAEYDMNAVYRLTCDIDTDFYDALIEDLQTRGIEPTADELKKIRRFFFPHVEYSWSIGDWGGTDWAFMKPGDSGYYYAYMPVKAAHGHIRTVYFKTITTCKLQTSGGTDINDYGTASGITTNAVLKYYELTDSRDQKTRVQLEGTGVSQLSGKPVYSYINAIDVSKLSDGLYEARGTFRTVDRNDQLKTVTLDSSSPESITPRQYSDLWWDDYDIDSIGTVIAKFHDADNEQESTLAFQYADGQSIYEMTSNEFLKRLCVYKANTGETSAEFVLAILLNGFTTNAQEVNFTPAELTMQGLPYLEAGDYLAIDDADSGTVNTYILRRTLRGIQTLYDEIESTGGEIIQGG